MEMDDDTLLVAVDYMDLRQQLDNGGVNGGQKRELTLRRVIHVPRLRRSMISAVRSMAMFEHI